MSSDAALVYQAIENRLGKNDFHIVSIEVKPASDTMLGFLGEYARITATYSLDGIEYQEIFFKKSAPKDNEDKAGYNDQYNTFGTEIVVYNEIFNQMENMPESEQWHGRCYVATKEVFIFEDLTLRGFKNADLNSTFDESHCLTALQSIARLHSECIILEHKQSLKRGKLYRLENYFGSALGESFYGYNSWTRSGMKALVKIIQKTEKYGGNSEKFEKIQSRIDELHKQATDLLKPSKENRNVLIHTDLWNNNMMFRYDKKPVQCMLVDFQAASIGPPAIDVSSILYMNLDRDLREKKLELFLKSYHEEFSRKLKTHSINSDKVLSWNRFRESYEACRLCALMQCLNVFQYLFLGSEQKARMAEDSLYFKLMQTEERGNVFYERLQGDAGVEKRYMSLVDELVEDFILKE